MSNGASDVPVKRAAVYHGVTVFCQTAILLWAEEKDEMKNVIKIHWIGIV